MATKIHLSLNHSHDSSYDVIIGYKFEQIARDIHKLSSRGTYYLITDDIVGRLYGKKFDSLFKKRGLKIHRVTIPHGERYKTRRMKEQIEDRLIELHADRQSVIIALGGGVIGDLAGFVASTLFRGIPFIQIPTTLLAQVDASIGGKTAVDHPLGKNLIGTFHQPERVYINTAVLSTLPEYEYKNGLAEVIKSAVILDKIFFAYLENHIDQIKSRDLKILNVIITRCCELKKQIVEKDEKESGLRRILNFGHTIGHAIERLDNFRVGHGYAVAIGMIIEANISQKLGYVNSNDVLRLRSLLDAFDLPLVLPNHIRIDDVLEVTKADKKSRNGTVEYTLLREIGHAEPGIGLTDKQMHRILGK
ncbi:MAG: 3-dehydroquinate synthase [Bacteroidota bacterium]